MMRPGRGAATRLAALSFAVVLAGLAAPSPPAAAQAPAPRLVLTDVSTIVAVGGSLHLSFDLRGSPSPDADVAVSVYPALGSRSEFDLAASGTFTRNPIEVL